MVRHCLVVFVILLMGCTRSKEGETLSEPPSSTGGAALSGTVKFSGTVNAPAVLNMQSDPFCDRQHQGKSVPSQALLVDNGVVANAFVYLKTGVTQAYAPPSVPVELDQKGCLYSPRIIGVQVGQALKILNSDATLHNVHALSKKNSNFNIGMTTAGQAIEKKFSMEEVMIRVKCDVHGWMSAYIGVLKHPFYAVTDPKGRFQISSVPDGEYEVEVWHEKLGSLTQKVTIKRSAAEIEFAYAS